MGRSWTFERVEHESHGLERHRAEQCHILLLPEHDGAHGIDALEFKSTLRQLPADLRAVGELEAHRSFGPQAMSTGSSENAAEVSYLHRRHPSIFL
jgi:hypothetical protein